jgi:hypothetical protein
MKKVRRIMLFGAVVVLGLAALGGLTLAGMRLMGTPRPPTWIALAHGAVAASGLALLISVVIGQSVDELVKVALGVLVLAGLGGATIFVGFHLRGQALPILLVLGHGLIAITGYILLLVGVYWR